MSIASFTRKAKAIQKKKGISFKAAQKMLSREMKGKVSGVKKKRVGAVKKKTVRKKTKVASAGRAVGSVSHHIGQAKTIIKEQLGRKLLARDMATTKTAKKKLGKEIVALKKKLRALA